MSTRRTGSARSQLPRGYCAIGWAAWLGWSGCVSIPDQAYAPNEKDRPRLVLTDYAGSSAKALDAPRVPRLRAIGLEPQPDREIEEIAWLFRGTADDALLADLERSPLVAAQRERVVGCAASWQGADLELLPRVPLPPGSEHVFAVAPWALDDADAPLVLEILTSDDPGSGARVSSAWPAAGSVAVGTDLPFALVAFDGEIQGANDGVWLEGPDGQTVEGEIEVDACEAMNGAFDSAIEGVTCVRVTPSAWLRPLSPYRIIVGTATRDLHGAPVGPFAAELRTASGPDAIAPAPVQRACAIDELSFALGCALVSDRSIALTLRANEPFVARVTALDHAQSTVAPSGEARVLLSDLEPGAEIVLDIELRDSTGNALVQTETFRTHTDLAMLSITEVRADPLGPEPSQELVELWNFGDRPIALAGMQLGDQTDELGAPLATDAQIDPGARVLLVAEGFDASEPNDVPVPPGTPLVRVGKSLGSAGLANRGEALFLRDAQGRRVSAAPSTPTPVAGVCSVRVTSDLRDGAPGSFALDPDQSCTPGW